MLSYGLQLVQGGARVWTVQRHEIYRFDILQYTMKYSLKKSKLHAVLKWKCKFKYDNNWAMVVLLYPILDILVSRNRIFWLNCYWNWVEFSCVAWHFVILINVEIENKLQILKLPFQFHEKYSTCNPFCQKVNVMLLLYHTTNAICSWLSYFSAVARSIISQ